ncbi:kinesin-like protein KIN-13A [Silene latifolia]|uniref:kinesin-like protein KIN-13A n=1 Tax=Silene latifolia TaxID=37657 RepID=UPI003D77F4DE
MQQSNAAAAAATALYDHPGGGAVGDAGDAVMARWLQSAGLQHLASPLGSNHLPNMLMQGYGPQSTEEKQRLLKLMRNLNLNGESGSEPYTPTGQSVSGDGSYSPDFRGDFGAGLLDLHAMDDTELLSEHIISEPFEPSPFMPGSTAAYDNDSNEESYPINTRNQRGQWPSDAAAEVMVVGKETSSKENNVAKLRVVVRKRPLNKKEIARKEDDVVTVYDNALSVHEPKLKVDLTAYVEKHEFCFDAILDEHVSNDEVYRDTVEPIIPTIFQRTKATCFAYGQTGSGKTFTMKPLPIRASEDLMRLLHHPGYRNQRFKLWLSYFEIYGGKLFDLLCDRKKLCMREDGRQQVCIVGLQEFEVSDVQIVKEYIEKGNASRSTGSTGANEESSRSHAILQLVVKKHSEIKDTRRNSNNDGNEAKNGKVIGKISFIDLAGSERGADTTDNDRQTRIEGAEINKSLLALKECIRALENDQLHIPFRGSKLTEVLRDSFVGNSKTVMISCISPNANSCEHTLNTLRYADRVKSLSKSGNSKKETTSGSLPVVNKESSSVPSSQVLADMYDANEQFPEGRAVTGNRRAVTNENVSYNPSSDINKPPATVSSSYNRNGRDVNTAASGLDKDNVEIKSTYNSKPYASYSETSDADESIEASPPRRKISSRDERSKKLETWLQKESGGPDPSTVIKKSQSTSTSNNVPPRHYEPESSVNDANMNAILEEEEALISAHRKEIEDTMVIVREEMKLLAEIDQPGSLIDNYVSQLSFVLSRKAAGLVSLQARLARFQHRLKEQEILSRKRFPR